jgi:hypothetical protein
MGMLCSVSFRAILGSFYAVPLHAGQEKSIKDLLLLTAAIVIRERGRVELPWSKAGVAPLLLLKSGEPRTIYTISYRFLRPRDR